MSKKSSEIIMIVAMTESGLIGRGGGLPWKCSLDMKWFQDKTTGWPLIVGKNTAAGMPVFPLRNRPCGLVWKDAGADCKLVSGQIFKSLAGAINGFGNFDKIFLAGGAELYHSALTAETPLVDTVIKTTFPDGHCDGDVYFKDMSLIGEPHFSLAEALWYSRFAESGPGFYTEKGGYNLKDGKMPGTFRDCEKNDTRFPWICFETWKRRTK